MKAGPVPAAVSQRYIPNIQARLVGITFPLARGGVRDGGASAQGGCRGGQRGPAPAAFGTLPSAGHRREAAPAPGPLWP